jgi:hypothetical protein
MVDRLLRLPHLVRVAHQLYISTASVGPAFSLESLNFPNRVTRVRPGGAAGRR